MGVPTARRRALDEQLLTHGPMPRELVAHRLSIMVQPGHAARTAARRRMPDEETDEQHTRQRKDIYQVGARSVANSDISNAKRDGIWFEEDGMIRHRDWQPAAGPMFTIPTREQVDAAGHLVFAHGWERAAFVAAFVSVRSHGGDRTGSKGRSDLAPHEFAALGFHGLASKNTVQRYAEAWRDAGLPRPHPGQQVALPTTPFPRWGEQADPAPPMGDTPRPPKPRSQQRSALDALIASNDPREWAAVQRRANKPPEFWEQVARHMKPRARVRARTRSGNVIQLTHRRSS